MLELQNISLKLPDQKEILKQIDLQLEDKKFIVVTGPNGGGKTTLAKVISGITWPTKGRVLLDGKDISNMGITERAQLGICYAFQQPVRFKGITVRDLLELAAGRQLEEAKLCDYLIEVGLCAQVIWIGKSIPAFLAAKSSELKLLQLLPEMLGSLFLMSRKPASIFGALIA